MSLITKVSLVLRAGSSTGAFIQYNWKAGEDGERERGVGGGGRREGGWKERKRGRGREGVREGEYWRDRERPRSQTDRQTDWQTDRET